MQHIHALELPPELPELSLMFGSRADGLNLSRPCERSACSWHRSGHVKGGFAVCIGGGDRRGVNRHDSCRVVARGAAQMCVGCVRCCLSGLPARADPDGGVILPNRKGPNRGRAAAGTVLRGRRGRARIAISRGRGPRSARGVRSRRRSDGVRTLGVGSSRTRRRGPVRRSGPRREHATVDRPRSHRPRRRRAAGRRRPRAMYKSQPIRDVSTRKALRLKWSVSLLLLNGR